MCRLKFAERKPGGIVECEMDSGNRNGGGCCWRAEGKSRAMWDIGDGGASIGETD